jgi:polysaccharide export outer membrane protein
MRKRTLLILFAFVVLINSTANFSYGAENTDHFIPGSQFYLGPEDVLEISVWKDEALTKEVVVRPDGKISFPLIGDVYAAGRTVEDLQEEIKSRIGVYVPDSPVTVVLQTINSPKVYVVGKVNRPGVYVMGRALTIMQALALAGGMTTFADEGDILIIREERGRQRFIEFDYGRVASGKDLEKNITLKPGDTVVVP